MKIENLKNITESTIVNSKDLIKQGCLGEIKLYTVIKKDLVLRYDLIEIQICPYTEEETVLSYENDKLIKYDRGQIIPLTIPALEELWLGNAIKGQALILIYSVPSESHKLASAHTLGSFDLNDVYYDVEQLSKSSIKSTRNKNSLWQAVSCAFKELGGNANNEEVYNWIKKQANAFTDSKMPFINDLDFEDDDIEPFTITNQSSTILKRSGRLVTKQRFQDICAECRKKL
jgi:hypothetical protein